MTAKKDMHSFKTWCEKHNRQDLINRFDYEKNTINIDEKICLQKTRFWLTCPRKIHESEDYCILKINDITKSCLCRKCQSFYQWTVDNQREDLLLRWDNDIPPLDVNFASNKFYLFKCERGIHKSQSFKLCNVTIFNSNVTCSKCNSVAQYIIDQYGEDKLYAYWNNNNQKSPWEVSRSSRETIILNCNNKEYHKEYKCVAYAFTSGGRCPYCAGKKIHPNDSLGVIIDKFNIEWSEKNQYSPYELPQRGIKEIYWVCENHKHEDYLRKIDTSNICEFRCPSCEKENQSSYLQEKVVRYLQDKYGYKIKHEYDCSLQPINPKTNRILPFDNEILDLRLEIETHGLQHYKITSWIVHAAKKHNVTPEEEFHKRKLYDRYKKYVALCSNFAYLAIPYWTERDESYKQLIDDKIAEILKAREVA